MNMKITLIAGLVMLAATVAVPAVADPGALAGSWKGPWYIGMSSGIATMEIAADGSGKIALTNLDEFGAQPVPLEKQAYDGKVFRFSATGANGAALTVGLQAENEGKKLRGNGKFGGFGTRLELQRTN
jgi:hypothetical protein